MNKDDIKLMKSQTLDDTDEGGGMMTTSVIESGLVNEVFPDISRLDRVYGRVSLRKVFQSVRTEDRDTYYGGHAIITEQAKDPLVSVLMFTTEDWFDYRTGAVDRLQSYLAVGPQYMSALYGDHYKGSRLLTLYMETTNAIPKVGEVYTLTANSIDYEYIRIIDVASEEISGLDAAGRAYKKLQVTMEISAALGQNYTGKEITALATYTTNATKINKTVVADASKYYGVTDLASDITKGDFKLKVNTIYQSLVPAAQSSSPLTDFGVGVLTASVVATSETTVSRTIAWTFRSNAVLLIGESLVPGSLLFKTYSDDGKGNFRDSVGTILGSVNYITGAITLASNTPTSSQSETLTYLPACTQSQISESGAIYVSLQNRGFSYVFNCYPTPANQTLRIDFLSGGTWYSLYDVGNGEIKGVDSSLGTGTLNKNTGTVSLSLGYLPDIDSNIFFFWGKSFTVVPISAETIPLTFEYELQDKQIGRNTLHITWSDGTTEYEIIDNGSGSLTQDGTAVGTIAYSTAKIKFTPTTTPIPSTNFEFSYAYGEPVVSTITPISGGDDATITLDLNAVDIIPNTVFFNIEVKTPTVTVIGMSGISYGNSPKAQYINDHFTRTVGVSDDGNGSLIDFASGVSCGTINYASGLVTFTMDHVVTYYSTTYANVPRYSYAQ